MIIVRPIRTADYDSLYDIAVDSGHGFTSLPVNEEILKDKIEHSVRSFSSNVSQPGSQGYLFVMENTETGEIIGTSGVEACVGLRSPFYHYHLGKVVHSSSELKVHNTVETLTLCNDNTGVSEICTLFLKKKARIDNNGRFLSRFRFLFMSEHKERFSDQVIAEMRGVSDEAGRSPFWAWLEEHFFSIDFPTADYLTGTGNKVFIAELMPKYPIYVNLLSKEAQQVINKVHSATKPALRLLESEGFCRTSYVDIFDAGPTISAQMQHIKTARLNQRLKVQISNNAHASNEENGRRQKKYILCNTKIEAFRAIQTKISLLDGDHYATISKEIAEHLRVDDDDWIRAIAN